MANPLSYKLEVSGVEDLKKSLTSAEKHFLDLSKSMSGVSKKVVGNKEDFNNLAKNTEYANKKIVESEKSRESVIQKTGGSIKSILGKEANAISEAGFGWKSFTTLIGGGSLVGFLFQAAEAFLHLDKMVRSFNTVLYGNSAAIRVSSSMLENMNGYLGYTREEISDVIKQGAEFGLFTGNTNKSAKALKEWSMQVLYLSKATGTSTASVGDMFYTMEKLYKLPHNQLRNISSAFSVIQKESAMAGDELAQYAKNLGKLFLRMPELSGKATTKLTSDLMVIAGDVKSKFGNPDEMVGMFANMLHMGNEQGVQALNFLASITGKTAYTIQESLKKGGNIEIYKDMAMAFASIPMDQFMRNAETWSRQTGLSVENMLAIRKSGLEGGKGLDDLKKKADAALKSGKSHEQAANAQQSRLMQIWNALKNAFDRIMVAVGGKVVQVITMLAVKAGPWIEHFLNKIEKWMHGDMKGSIFEQIPDMLKKAKVFIETNVIPVFIALKDAILWVVDTGSTLVSWGSNVVGVFRKIWDVMGMIPGATTAITEAIKFLIFPIGTLVKAAYAAYKIYKDIHDADVSHERAQREKERMKVADLNVKRYRGDISQELGKSITTTKRGISRISDLMSSGYLSETGQVGMLPFMANEGERLHYQKLFDETIAKSEKFLGEKIDRTKIFKEAAKGISSGERERNIQKMVLETSYKPEGNMDNSEEIKSLLEQLNMHSAKTAENTRKSPGKVSAPLVPVETY